MSDIANNESFVQKYIGKKMKYIRQRTITGNIETIKPISSYVKEDINTQIGLKLNTTDIEATEQLLQHTIDFTTTPLFYELKLRYKTEKEGEIKTRNICSLLTKG